MYKYIFLIIIVIIGAFFRFYQLGSLPISGDESFHALAVEGILNSGIPKMPNGELYLRATPLLYLQALSFKILGEDERAIRLPTAILGTIDIILIYYMVFLFTGDIVLSLISALLFCISPWAIATARIARMYEALLTATILIFIFWNLWYFSKKNIYFFLLVLITLIAILLHKLAILAGIVLIIPLIFDQGLTYRKILSSLTFLLIVLYWFFQEKILIILL